MWNLWGTVYQSNYHLYILWQVFVSLMFMGQGKHSSSMRILEHTNAYTVAAVL